MVRKSTKSTKNIKVHKALAKLFLEMFAKLLGKIMELQALLVLAIANKHNHSKVLLFLLYT